MYNTAFVAIVHGFDKLSKPSATSNFIYVLVLAYNVKQAAVFSIFHYYVDPRRLYYDISNEIKMRVELYTTQRYLPMLILTNFNALQFDPVTVDIVT